MGILENTTAKSEIQKERRKAAEARNAVWAALGPAKQLEALDRRLGEGKGAVKQRLRLHAAIKLHEQVLRVPPKTSKGKK